MISEAALADLKARNPCDQVAGKWVKLRKHGKKLIGPCPLHSPDPQARDSTAFECDADGWVCAVCADGGDVIKLMMKREDVDFPRAVELLGGSAEPSADRAAELEREREEKRQLSEREANSYRERERKVAFDIWHAGAELRGSWAEDYLIHRGLVELPDRVPLRFAPDVAYFHGEAENEVGRMSPRVVYRGPAMLAAIVDAERRFRAVHITWLDPVKPGRKAWIRDTDSEDPNATLPAKKVRGSKAGNIIRVACMSEWPHTLMIGEGIETVLSVWLALLLDRRRNKDTVGMVNMAFWSAVDLGNLAGKAADSVPHPTLKDKAGRTRRVPGAEPDLRAPGLTIPESVTDLVLLGDGDSDRFTTQCALARSARRYAAPGRSVRVAWAPDGEDFNDELRRAA
jgi:hypothetical protein